MIVAPGEAAGLVRAFGDLWLAVTRAGGAVGFSAADPEHEIRSAAADRLAAVTRGAEDLLVLGDAADLTGTVFLRRGDDPRIAHRGEMKRLMVHPGAQGRGLGRALVDAAVAHARRLGLEQLLLSARGGTGLPAFYTGLGWTEVGVFPDALHLGGDDRRDEHWFQLLLR